MNQDEFDSKKRKDFRHLYGYMRAKEKATPKSGLVYPNLLQVLPTPAAFPPVAEQAEGACGEEGKERLVKSFFSNESGKSVFEKI